MITAKNYAAQAERGIDNCFIVSTPNVTQEQTREWSSQFKPMVKDVLRRGVHFAIPDDGIIFDDKWKALHGETVPMLPYPEMTVEFIVNRPENKKMVVVAQQPDKNSDICINTMAYSDTRKGWMFIPAAIIIKNGSIVDSDAGVPFGILSMFSDKDLEDFGIAIALQDGINPLFELLEALSCRNVSTANHQDAFKDNNKRIKDGKLPFYETKMLVIDTQYTPEGKTGNGGVSHASPRQHLRRGHIRRHATAGNIWIQSSVVGDPAKGSINKSYRVK